MKNKITSYLFIIFFCFLNQNLVSANEIEFNASEIILTENEGVVKASEGKVRSIKDGIEITASEFTYDKNLLIINAAKNVKVVDLNRSIEAVSNNINYDVNNQIINIIGDVNLVDVNKDIKIESQNIIYDVGNKIIKSNVSSVITDIYKNIITTENFSYNINDKLIRINKSKFIDSQKNIFEIETGYLDLLSNRLIAKDISVEFNSLAFNKDNDPRVKGKTLSVDENGSEITKGVFTLCKKTDRCPPWQLLAENIKHDKNKKTVFYKNAWLKLYDKPVFYFPKFFHPDPSVKRQSGFLMPSFVNSSTVGTSINVPYFKVISDNKDLTLSPRLYSGKKLMLQTEYRQVEKDSNHIFDFSFFKDNSSSMKGHLFARSNKKINFLDFEESEISFNTQQSSHDNYLKKYKVESPEISASNILVSELELTAYSEDTSFDTKFTAYEDLGKTNNDRFEYVYPSFNLTKLYNLDNELSSDFKISSSGYIKNYETNIYEKVLINDFLISTKNSFTQSGLKNSYNFLIKNVNTEGKKSSNYENNLDQTVGALFEFNSSYPLLKKIDNSYDSTLMPKISLRYSPNNTKNMKNENKRLNVENVFSLNRIGKGDTLENGGSLTYGFDYAKITETNDKIFESRFANVIRLEQNNNLPNTSGLNKKTSDFFSAFQFTPNDNLKLNYDFSIDENLTKKNYEFLETEVRINNFVTSFEYLNENNSNKTSYIGNKTSYLINNDSKIMFSTRENKETRFTEFVNLIYEYTNDCLVAAVEYNKEYYSDKDLKPEENIFFKLTIIPFGQTKSPSFRK